MHIRLDEEVWNAKDCKSLGIDVGDFVCFEPYYTETASGFIKSKFMDNKASCFVLMELARLLPKKTILFNYFSLIMKKWGTALLWLCS
jgi:putative aminopeptidase FrvX